MRQFVSIDNGKRFIVQAEEILTAFLEAERAIHLVEIAVMVVGA